MSETRRKEKGNAETASGFRAASISRTADFQGNQPFSKNRAARKDMTFGKQAFYNPYPRGAEIVELGHVIAVGIGFERFLAVCAL